MLVNSVCPGWVRTEMGGANARRSAEEGDDTVVCFFIPLFVFLAWVLVVSVVMLLLAWRPAPWAGAGPG